MSSLERAGFKRPPSFKPFRLGAASRLGASHEAEGSPNQDSAVVTGMYSGQVGSIAILAVSDGAGSASQSHHGSSAACVGAVESLQRQIRSKPPIALKGHLLKSSLQRAVRQARRKVILQARHAGASNSRDSIREYACTLMVVALTQDMVGVAHVGDGCVVAGDGAEWQLLSEPENGEFANETTFLTDRRNLPRIRIASASDINCLAVITDGLQNVALSLGTVPYERFWTPLYSALNRNPDASPDAVLESLLQKVGRSGKASDDCTIAVCMRQP